MAQIETYLNYPWRLFAHPKQTGKADCFGIAAHYLNEEMGLDIREFETVSPQDKKRPLHPFEIIRIMTQRYKKYLVDFTQVTDPQKGDLAVWRRGSIVEHLGVFVSPTEILTSYTSKGSCLVDHEDSPVECWRHQSLQDN